MRGRSINIISLTLGPSYTAALKCRQRKKAWLAQLQAKVEYLSNDNDRLTAALVAAREEISRLSALVGAAGVGVGAHHAGSGVNGVAQVNGVTNGVNGHGVNGNSSQAPPPPPSQTSSSANGANGPPVSVNVSLPGTGKSVAAMVGGGGSRGYGY